MRSGSAGELRAAGHDDDGNPGPRGRPCEGPSADLVDDGTVREDGIRAEDQKVGRLHRLDSLGVGDHAGGEARGSKILRELPTLAPRKTLEDRDPEPTANSAGREQRIEHRLASAQCNDLTNVRKSLAARELQAVGLRSKASALPHEPGPCLAEHPAALPRTRHATPIRSPTEERTHRWLGQFEAPRDLSEQAGQRALGPFGPIAESVGERGERVDRKGAGPSPSVGAESSERREEGIRGPRCGAVPVRGHRPHGGRPLAY